MYVSSQRPSRRRLFRRTSVGRDGVATFDLVPDGNYAVLVATESEVSTDDPSRRAIPALSYYLLTLVAVVQHGFCKSNRGA